MWSSWSDQAKGAWKQAVEKTGDALEKTGDALSHVGAVKKKEEETADGEKKPGEEGTATEETTEKGETVVVAGESTETAASSQPVDLFKNLQTGWSSVFENTKQSVKTVQSKIEGGKNAPVSDEPAGTVAGRYAEGESATATSPASADLFANFHTGWTSVVEQTKQSIKTAQTTVEDQQHKMAKRIQKARTEMQKRDAKLPLDVPALRDAQVVYITDRLITLSHPAMASSQDGEITAERKLAAVAHMLQRRHGGRYMMWNLSEVDYDTGMLDDQVLNFSFPGSPSPPLGLMLKLLVSMESWLKADDRNVVVVHCLTGKGRTSTVLAAFLCWMGEAGFGDVYQALEYIARCKKVSLEELTIPSQRRYASYFKNMLDGVRPSQPPLMLKRVVVSEAPKYAKGPARESDGEKMDDAQLMGCAPYLQIFKAGSLVHTAPASLHFQQPKDELPFCRTSDGQISFQLNQVVQGDILIRCRHLTARKQRVSMFRAAFHTGYAPPNVMRLTKSQLDGACTDDRYSDDFYIDVIFEPIDAEAASKVMQEGETETPGADEHASVEAAGSSQAQALAGGGTTVRASAYDVMLHRDSRFWDVIAKRNEAHSKEEAANSDPMFGHTVGRRREFGSEKKSEIEKAESTAMQTFSIGGEFDFLPSDEPKPVAVKPAPKPKDGLMEALMGALDEAEGETETIVFSTGDETPSKQSSAPSSVGAPSEASSVAEASKASTEAGKSTEEMVDDMDALLADANLDFDVDMDALLAGVSGEDGLLDDDDDDLDDLESFLAKK